MSPPEPASPSTTTPLAGERWPASKVGLLLLAIVAVIIIGAALRAAAVVIVPLVLSFLIALMVAPVDHVVHERMPRRLKWLGHVAAMGVIIVVLAVFAGGVWVAAQRVVAQFPQISEELQAMAGLAGSGGGATSGSSSGAGTAAADIVDDMTGAQDTAADGGGDSQRLALPDFITQFRGAGGQLGSRMADWATGYATSILGSTGSALGSMVLIFFFVLLMLIEAPAWRTKVSRILASDERDRMLDSFSVIARQMRRYLLVRMILGLITGALYATWLWLFDVDLLIVWALLAFLLNFIPTLGSLLAGALPVIYALVQKDFSTALLIGAGILVIEQVMGNYVDPKVQGRQLSLSPLVVLVVLLIWGWVWGVAGALLAVPVTMSLVVMFAHVPRLRPVALFLSDERDYHGLDRIASSD
ncbi:AI-2E family transporter [Aquibium sp. ELW1220]|uniref:AI-2E family transporter n=1 Tax=Aquibium sp. ELW1220 TaxID=2976766 RepID=UPI0025B0501B|nr:AI-2E family transporter [Aquibium sp. ELW1220]MDN2580184.1 AI-2E family transporter [Aquibium sp. ELW1220]